MTLEKEFRAEHMLTERAVQTPQESTKQHEIYFDIRDIYSTENDAKLLKKMAYLPPEQQRFFITSELVGMVGEHAGGIPYKTIHYIQKKDGSLNFCGLDTLDMYRSTAELAGHGSREENEYNGIKKVHEALANGYNSVDWNSPPYCATRGFVFSFRRLQGDQKLGGAVVKEFVLKYDTPSLHDLEVAQYIHKAIGNTIGQASDTSLNRRDDFLDSPIMYNTQHPENIDYLLNIIGVTSDGVEYSQKFERTLQTEGAHILDRYMKHLYAFADIIDQPYHPDYQWCKQEADNLVEMLFIYGSNIKNILTFSQHRISTKTFEQLSETIGTSHFAEAMQLFKQKNKEFMKVIGGSDCMVTKRDGLFSDFVLNKLFKGTPIERLYQQSGDYKDDPNLCRCGQANGPHFHCPGKESSCGHPIIVGEGTEKCPKCGAGKVC